MQRAQGHVKTGKSATHCELRCPLRICPKSCTARKKPAAPATVVLEQNSSPTAKQRIRKVAMRRVKIHSGVPGATSSMVPSASATPPSRPPAAPAGPNGPAASSRTEPRPTADPAHATRPTADPAQATRPSPSAETATWSATRSAATRSAATRSATRSTATGSTTTWKASTQCGCNARFIGQIHPGKDAHDTDIAGLIGQIHPGKDAHDTDVAGLIGQIHPGKGVADDTVIAGLIGQIHPGKGIADDTDIAGLVGQILPGKDIDAAEVPMQARGMWQQRIQQFGGRSCCIELADVGQRSGRTPQPGFG